jgi:hypothetical protein
MRWILTSRVRTPPCADMEEGADVNGFIAVEDGHLFLSRDDLFSYRTQEIEMIHEKAYGSDIHVDCNGSGETQVVDASTGAVRSLRCQGCNGTGSTAG